jgi:hypothetical protein
MPLWQKFPDLRLTWIATATSYQQEQLARKIDGFPHEDRARPAGTALLEASGRAE